VPYKTHIEYVARQLPIAAASHERVENRFPDAGGLHSALYTSKPAFLGRPLPGRQPADWCLALNQMKGLIKILFPSSIQKTLQGDGDRISAQVKTKPIGARKPTMLFPMSLTLEGYHVCGGPVFE
jgi:hypothetical protein